MGRDVLARRVPGPALAGAGYVTITPEYRRTGAAGDDVTLHEWTRVDHFDLIDPQSSVWPLRVAAVDRIAAG